jgi:hypothetical protein
MGRIFRKGTQGEGRGWFFGGFSLGGEGGGGKIVFKLTLLLLFFLLRWCVVVVRGRFVSGIRAVVVVIESNVVI